MNPVNALLEIIQNNKLWEDNLSLKRNDYLVKPGTLDTNIYFVEEGSVRMYSQLYDEENVLRFGYSGNLIAVLDSFISEQPTSIYIQALKLTKLKSMPKLSLMELIDSNKEASGHWNKIQDFLILQQLEREQDILCQSPKERYERVLKRSPHLFQNIPNKHIASYLRMTPETLSRLKKS